MKTKRYTTVTLEPEKWDVVDPFMKLIIIRSGAEFAKKKEQHLSEEQKKRELTFEENLYLASLADVARHISSGLYELGVRGNRADLYFNFTNNVINGDKTHIPESFIQHTLDSIIGFAQDKIEELELVASENPKDAEKTLTLLEIFDRNIEDSLIKYFGIDEPIDVTITEDCFNMFFLPLIEDEIDVPDNFELIDRSEESVEQKGENLPAADQNK